MFKIVKVEFCPKLKIFPFDVDRGGAWRGGGKD